MCTTGYFLVFSDPGDKVTEAEYTDWYDNEHVPLRLDIPAFVSWTRWKAADGKRPGWTAAYDLTSLAGLVTPPYTKLAETRSEREQRLFKELAVLEGSAYELQDPAKLPPPSALYDAKKPARFTMFARVDVTPEGEEAFNKWYDEEHIPTLAKLPGWVRSRRFVLKQWGRVGIESQTNQEPVPKYLAVHEWESLDAVKDPEQQKESATPLQAEVEKVVLKKDIRVFTYYKHWERESAK